MKALDVFWLVLSGFVVFYAICMALGFRWIRHRHAEMTERMKKIRKGRDA